MLLIFLVSSLLTKDAWADKFNITFSENIPIEVQNNAQLMINQKIVVRDVDMSTHRKQQVSSRIASIIETAAQPYGYFSTQCQVQHVNAEYNFHATCTMGPPVYLKQIDVEINGPGKKKVETLTQKSKMTLQIGSIFRADKYEDYKKQLLNIANHAGYVDASTNASQLIIDTDKQHASTKIILDTGPLYRFGEIFIEQQIYDKSFLRKLAPYAMNTEFNTSLISSYKDNLESTNLFANVSVLPNAPNNESKTIPTQVFYEPIPRTQYGLGIGYSSYANLFYSASIQRSLLNDRGMRSTTDFLNSDKYAYAITTLSIPRTHPTQDYFNIQLGYKKQFIDYVGTDRSLTTTLAHITQRRPNNHTSLAQEIALNYSVDRSEFEDNTANHTNLLYPSLKYNWLIKQLKNNATLALTSDMSASVKPFIAPNNFYKLVLQQRYNRASNDKKRMVQIRGKQGYIASDNKSSPLPLGWYFYTGGTYSVRGFAYNSIGADPNETNDYNRYLYTGSLELQHLVSKDLFAIVYMDGGDATKNLSTSKPSYAIGSGILWKTLAGNLEVSMAKPIVNHSGNTSMKTRLNINIHQPLIR